jgi:tetratricopeptide (TPR) repeat protein
MAATPGTPPTQPLSTVQAKPAGGSALRRLLPLLLIGLALIGAALWLRSSPAMREAIYRGKDLPELEALVQANPRDSIAQYYLAKSYYLNRRFDAAQSAYEATIRLEPRSARAHLGLALALNEQGLLPQAKTNFERALALDKNLAWAEYMLGKLYWAEGNIEQAIPHVKRAVELDPRSDPAWYGLAVCYMQQRRYDQAIEALQKAIERNNQARYHTALGEVLVYQGKIAEGEKHYAEALRLDPNFGPACALMGGYYLKRGAGPDALDRAEELLLRATRLKTHRPQDLYLDLGQLYIRKKRYNEAIAALQKAIEADKRDERPYYALANAYRRAGKEAEAAATEAQFKRMSALHVRMINLEARLSHRPDETATQLELARVYRDIGFDLKAAERYLAYIRRNPNDTAVIQEYEQLLRQSLAAAGQPVPEFMPPALPQ